MRRFKRKLGLSLVVLMVIPRAGSAQTDADVVGIMRQDGIGLPHFEWRNGTWASVRGDSLPLLSAVIVRDSTGRSDSFATLETVSVNDGYDYTGWRIQMPQPDDPRLRGYPRPRVGYIVSATAGDAPFRRRPMSESDPLRSAMIRALESTTDTILPPVAVDAWEATLGTTEVVFFEVGSGPGVIGCYGTITSGWYRDGWDAPIVATHQVGGDCEKGVEHRTPWALLERGGGLYSHVSVSGWEGAEYELWSLEDGASRVAVFP